MPSRKQKLDVRYFTRCRNDALVCQRGDAKNLLTVLCKQCRFVVKAGVAIEKFISNLNLKSERGR